MRGATAGARFASLLVFPLSQKLNPVEESRLAIGPTGPPPGLLAQHKTQSAADAVPQPAR